MAISVIDRVWKKSKANGNGLLLMLAIADHANEHGKAWPGFRTLQAKCKIQNRQTVSRNLRQLEVLGELIIEWKAGPHGTNWYQVCSGLPLEMVDGLRKEMELPSRAELEQELESQVSPEQGEKPKEGMSTSEVEEVVTGVNQDKDEGQVSPASSTDGEVVTGLNHLENEWVVQSGYGGGSIGIGVVQSGYGSGHTAEPKPLLTVRLNRQLTDIWQAEKFSNFVGQLEAMIPGRTKPAEILEELRLVAVGEDECGELWLRIGCGSEYAVRYCDSRMWNTARRLAQGMDMENTWNVEFVYAEKT